ncbi:LysR substrate-binding domain-containing protein [uncultured Aquitalea sp.]|uniref:LysR substrate-binding domain-containing protein n=1 Tax=uncultured Aquitalea sp. TaxID=540272 RepID=UPI0025DEBF8B|nr:LysR substrate-binding domain-containing protein [uncultured Aquitalea sp.]
MHKRLPPMQSLLAFEAAARHGNFSRAAEELALTQSAVSHQIQLLEDWVRQPLFRRIGRGVALTGAGEVFLQTARDTLRLISEGRDRIEPYRNMNSVLIWCGRDFAAGALMQWLPGLHAAFPDIEVWVVTGSELREFDRIDVDLIVSSRPIRHDDVSVSPLLQDRELAVCSPTLHARLSRMAFPQCLSAAALLHDERRPDWAPWLPALRQQGLPLRRGATFEDAALLMAAAERGLGIARLSASLVAGAIEAGSLAHLSQVPTEVGDTLWLMKPKGAARTPVAEAVWRWLLERGRLFDEMASPSA